MSDRVKVSELCVDLAGKMRDGIVVRGRMARQPNNDALFTLFASIIDSGRLLVLQYEFCSNSSFVGITESDVQPPRVRSVLIFGRGTFEEEVRKWCPEWQTDHDSVIVEERGGEKRLLSKSNIGVFVALVAIAGSLRGLTLMDGPWKEPAAVLCARLQGYIVECRALVSQVTGCV
jgi:hypothetical protein